MNETIKTHWLTPEGAISVHTITVEDDGFVSSESGDPAPKGTELTSEALTRMFRKDYLADREAHEAAQKRGAAEHKKAVKAQEDEVAVLSAAGLSDEVIAILAPNKLRAFKPASYSPPASAAESMMGYGLDGDQIQRVLGGGV